MNGIETESLVKRYGERVVVNGVSMSVPEGCVYGFIGPNGAGKSTTMKMMLGLTRPSAGSIRLMGRTMNPENRLSLLRNTGSLIESPSGYGHLTAQENMEIVAGLKDVPKRDIDRVLAIVSLLPERNKLVRKLSLGMKQRLGIAQALLGKPKLLVLDEPTNGLDPSGIQEMRSLIRSLPAVCGATVLISSHLLGELEQTVDRVGIIRRGSLIYEGDLQALRSRGEERLTLRALCPEKAARVLAEDGIYAGEGPCFALPALPEDALARLSERIAASGAGIVELHRQENTLEEIFLKMTGEGEP